MPKVKPFLEYYSYPRFGDPDEIIKLKQPVEIYRYSLDIKGNVKPAQKFQYYAPPKDLSTINLRDGFDDSREKSYLLNAYNTDRLQVKGNQAAIKAYEQETETKLKADFILSHHSFRRICSFPFERQMSKAESIEFAVQVFDGHLMISHDQEKPTEVRFYEALYHYCERRFYSLVTVLDPENPQYVQPETPSESFQSRSLFWGGIGEITIVQSTPSTTIEKLDSSIDKDSPKSSETVENINIFSEVPEQNPPKIANLTPLPKDCYFTSLPLIQKLNHPCKYKGMLKRLMRAWLYGCTTGARHIHFGIFQEEGNLLYIEDQNTPTIPKFELSDQLKALSINPKDPWDPKMCLDWYHKFFKSLLDTVMKEHKAKEGDTFTVRLVRSGGQIHASII